MKLSGVQKIAKFFSSAKKFEAMKAESMQWGFTCSSCNHESNIWAIGGIRYKAKGNPKTRIKCPNCRVAAMQSIVKSEV
jgi:transcription elongation factor Elf1